MLCVGSRQDESRYREPQSESTMSPDVFNRVPTTSSCDGGVLQACAGGVVKTVMIAR